MPDFFHTDFITFNIFHLIIFAFLFFILLIYFKIAKKYNITYVSSFPVGMRLIIQLVAVGLIFFGLEMHYMFPWWALLIACVVCIGIVNAYSFMNGIAGMTGLNSLVILSSLQYVNQHVVSFVHPDFIIYAILACVAFLFFNARNQVNCVAGDVSSIGIACGIIVLLLKLILETEDVIWILFLAVYGVDAVCTMGHRIYLKQNILEPHRMHFYQVWVEKTKCSHLWMSVVYAIIQLMICIIVISFWKRIPGIMMSLILFGLLVTLYVLKFQHNLNDVSE